MLGVYAWCRHSTGSDDIARAMTFTALVLSNIGLIYVNRTWDSASWRSQKGMNRYFVWMTLFTVLLLAAILVIPGAARLFAFVSPPAWMLFVAVGVALIGALWFEAVKWYYRR